MQIVAAFWAAFFLLSDEIFIILQIAEFENINNGERKYRYRLSVQRDFEAGDGRTIQTRLLADGGGTVLCRYGM